MNDLTTTVDTYLGGCNETSLVQRWALIKKSWCAVGGLFDPPLAADGHAGIDEMTATMQQQFPGHRFRRSSGIDTHHDHLRFGWELVSPDGAVVLAGMDVAEVGDDGRLRRVTGFFGELPAA